MARVIAYIDGFNLYYGIRRFGNAKWLNIEALVRAYLDAGDTLERIHYFTARVKGSPENPESPQRQQTYLRALATLPLVDIHYGHFTRWRKPMPLVQPIVHLKPEPERAMVWKVEEKGSDVALGSRLVADAYESTFDVALVVSNDTDLCPPIEIATTRGLAVGVLNPQDGRGALALRRLATFYKEVREGAVRTSQFPDPVFAPNVNPIPKPSGRGWSCPASRPSQPSSSRSRQARS